MNHFSNSNIIDTLKNIKHSITLQTYVFVLFSFLMGRVAQWVPSPVPAFVYSLILGIISWTIIKEVVDNIIDNKIADIEEVYQSEIKDRSTDKLTDFASLLEDKYLYDARWLDDVKQENESPNQLKARLKRKKKRFLACQDAVHGLCFSEINNGKEHALIGDILRTAFEDLKNVSISNIPKKDLDKINNQSEDLQYYLRAWLVCSIKYDTDLLPIEWIDTGNMKKEEILKFLNYIKNNVIHRKGFLAFFKYPESINVIEEYLESLIKKIHYS